MARLDRTGLRLISYRVTALLSVDGSEVVALVESSVK